ncbi:MAG: hypothetical protein JJU13_05985 [Balneolaceae bacterium]|nr:hypothetical protein [Balneolaceae bacterium]
MELITEIIEIIKKGKSEGEIKSIPNLKYQLFKNNYKVDDSVLLKVGGSLSKIEGVKKHFDGKMMQTSPGSFSRVTLNTLATWFIHRANESNVENTINELQNFLGQSKTEAIKVLILENVFLPEPLHISSNLQLVPLNKLSNWVLYPLLSLLEFNPGLLQSDGIVNRAALISNVEFGPKFVDEVGDNYYGKDDIKDEQLLFSRFLTLLGEYAVVPSTEWYALKPSTPCAGFTGVGARSQAPDTLKNGMVLFMTKKFWSEQEEFFYKYWDLSEEIQLKLRIPIERLNQSRRRRFLVDLALEQGIAYESLFLPVNTEQLSLMLRLRVSKFCGESVEERKEIMNLIKAMYSIRSSAVHNGKVEEKTKVSGKGKMYSAEILRESDKILVNAIKKIIGMKRFPDWDKLLLS